MADLQALAPLGSERPSFLRLLERIMNFELSEEQQLLQDSVRRFVNERVKPNARVWDRQEAFPADVVSELAEMGLMGVMHGAIMPSRDMIVRSVTPDGAFGKVFGFVTSGFSIGGIIYLAVAHISTYAQ